MAIINCPGCRRRISNQVRICPHCDLPMGELTSEDLYKVQLKHWRKRVYQAANLSYLAFAMLIGGALWWFGAAPTGWNLPVPMGAVVLVSVGVVLYLVARGWLFWLKMPRNRPNRPT